MFGAADRWTSTERELMEDRESCERSRRLGVEWKWMEEFQFRVQSNTITTRGLLLLSTRYHINRLSLVCLCSVWTGNNETSHLWSGSIVTVWNDLFVLVRKTSKFLFHVSKSWRPFVLFYHPDCGSSGLRFGFGIIIRLKSRSGLKLGLVAWVWMIKTLNPHQEHHVQ